VLYSLITEWRISKRVEEQFNAFITGFNELIPPDLVNVFDERELELLIGGIADIDVEDWKKHTDYRGYTENDEVIVNFWKVIEASSSFLNNCLRYRHSVCEVGMQNRNPDCCSLLLVHLVFLLMDSKICKEVMGLVDSLSKRLVNSYICLSHIHGNFATYLVPNTQTDACIVSTDLICHLTNHMML